MTGGLPMRHRFAVVLGGIAALVSAAGLVVLKQTQEAVPADRCEIHIRRGICPAQAGPLPMISRDMLLDGWENASRVEAQCLKRAEDYFKWCNATRPVTARFYVARKLYGSETYPKGSDVVE
jgi:hypothetical protein